MILYNTSSRKKEVFLPIKADHIRMYVCGPTVYDRAHIGNARPVVVFDVLFRLLSHLYPKVTYVRNITDIDDKIIKAAEEQKVSIQEITEKNTKFYMKDMAAIGALPPSVSPKATDHIVEMQEMIKDLIQKEFAYEKEGHVLFNVAAYASYGKLSKLNLNALIQGARVEVAPYKKNPHDFVLWKPSTESQPGWESPWGRGRPGWHIECSAMAQKHLGETFDIHGGGIDLVFPHHENEIAQSECAHNGQVFAKVWMHNGHLIVNGEKMSKSLGNFLTVHDLLEKYPGEAIRLTLLSAHYRQPLDWREDTVKQSKSILDRFYKALEGTPDGNGTIPAPFLAALKDDLNVPEAFSILHGLVSDIHKETNQNLKEQLQLSLRSAGQLMGFLNRTPEDWFQGSAKEDSSWIEELINIRNEAKKNKDFKKADEIRDKLQSKGILLEDSPKGTIWKKL